MKKSDKVAFILIQLAILYPDAACSLDNDGTAFQLFVRAILSAQCTDLRVNTVTKELFKEYPDAEAFAQEDEAVIGQKIKSCGLCKAKAHGIVASSQMLISEFNGQIPEDAKTLERFPGVGRKIANLIMGEVYEVPAIVVDTHCGRVARRLGLTKSDSPAVIEKDLCACIPKDQWITLGHRMVAHGRGLCTARNPKCLDCPMSEVCTYVSQRPSA